MTSETSIELLEKPQLLMVTGGGGMNQDRVLGDGYIMFTADEYILVLLQELQYWVKT